MRNSGNEEEKKKEVVIIVNADWTLQNLRNDGPQFYPQIKDYFLGNCFMFRNTPVAKELEMKFPIADMQGEIRMEPYPVEIMPRAHGDDSPSMNYELMGGPSDEEIPMLPNTEKSDTNKLSIYFLIIQSCTQLIIQRSVICRIFRYFLSSSSPNAYANN